MKVNTKAKWIVGLTGAAFSAFVLGQLDDTPTKATNTNNGLSSEVTDTMSKREKELVQLDWNDFVIQENNNYRNGEYYDRTTRRT